MDDYYESLLEIFVDAAKVCPNCGVVRLRAGDSEVCSHCPGMKLVRLVRLQEYLERL